ncbi:hypothetical protein LCGC14_1636180 [marine sediment metagenome]|uniref:Uncharacterized protein n=1 Tax=marine sediment metagenome TaxID=412755 RepID=A0A0F9KGR4_9ZZZZ
MPTRRKIKKKELPTPTEFPHGWTIGAVFWRDPTLFTDPLTEEKVCALRVVDSLYVKCTVGFYRQDESGDYVVCSEISMQNGEVQMEQITFVPKALVIPMAELGKL